MGLLLFTFMNLCVVLGGGWRSPTAALVEALIFAARFLSVHWFIGFRLVLKIEIRGWFFWHPRNIELVETATKSVN